MDILEFQIGRKLYTVRTAGAILGSPRITVIRWIREGKLKAFKFRDGRLWRIKESDLLAFIKAPEEGDLEDYLEDYQDEN
jgi:excisionase family DNA binding protein